MSGRDTCAHWPVSAVLLLHRHIFKSGLLVQIVFPGIPSCMQTGEGLHEGGGQDSWVAPGYSLKGDTPQY